MGKLTKEEILEKAKKILDLKNHEKVCLKANICPECGKNLKKTNHSSWKEGFSWSILECECGFKHKFNIFYLPNCF